MVFTLTLVHSLYEQDNGIYISPKFLTDDWHLWFEPNIAELLEKVILGAILVDGVNINKVYLLDFMPKDYCIDRIATKLADKLAVMAVASYPNESVVSNLNNVVQLSRSQLDLCYSVNLSSKRSMSLIPDDINRIQSEDGNIDPQRHWMIMNNSMVIP